MQWESWAAAIVIDELDRFDADIDPRDAIKAMSALAAEAVARGEDLPDEEGLRAYVQGLLLDMADEQPGAELLSLPATVELDATVWASILVGLAEAALVHRAVGHVTNTIECLQIISTLGQRHDVDGYKVPPAALPRAARNLERAAAAVHDRAPLAPGVERVQLAARFAEHAALLRSLKP